MSSQDSLSPVIDAQPYVELHLQHHERFNGVFCGGGIGHCALQPTAWIYRYKWGYREHKLDTRNVAQRPVAPSAGWFDQ